MMLSILIINIYVGIGTHPKDPHQPIFPCKNSYIIILTLFGKQKVRPKDSCIA